MQVTPSINILSIIFGLELTFNLKVKLTGEGSHKGRHPDQIGLWTCLWGIILLAGWWTRLSFLCTAPSFEWAGLGCTRKVAEYQSETAEMCRHGFSLERCLRSCPDSPQRRKWNYETCKPFPLLKCFWLECFTPTKKGSQSMKRREVWL